MAFITDTMKKTKAHRHHFEVSILRRPAIDRERLKIDLNIERSGREDGLRGVPDSEAKTFGAKENEILAKIEDEQRSLGDQCGSEMSVFQARLALYSPQTRINEMKQVGDKAITDIRVATQLCRDELNEHSRNLVSAEGALTNFQRRHRREGAPHLPKSRVFAIGFVFLLFFIEASINAVFFASGDDFGLVGGMVSALVLGLFNTFIALLCGIGARGVNHVNWLYKVLGGFVIAFYAIAALFVNFLVGHYRDIAENLQLDNPAQAIVAQLGWGVLTFNGLTSINSILMIGAGLFFSLACFIDGFWVIADTYPGYATVYMRKEKTVRDFISCKQFAYGQIDFLTREAHGEINKLLKEVEQGARNYVQAVQSRKNWVDAFVEYQAYLEGVANDLLTAYREANRSTRKTPVPNYFNTTWRLQQKPVPDYGFNAMNDAELTHYVNEAAQASRKHAAEVTEVYNQALNEFRRIEELTPL